MNRRLLPVASLLALLHGCASLSDTLPVSDALAPANWPERQAALNALDNWELQGKLAVRQAERSESAVINFWRQDGEQFQVQLSSTFLGMGATELQGTPHALILTTHDGERYTSDKPAALLQAETGWHLPLEQLPYWIKGIPAPGPGVISAFSSNGQPSVIEQSGWIVRIERHQEAAPPLPPLPARLTLEHGSDRIRIVIHRWITYPGRFPA